MKNTLQLEYKSILTIIQELNLNDPYLMGPVDNKLELFKFLAKNGQFSNFNPRNEQLSVTNEKITKNAIVFLKSQVMVNNHLIFPKNSYWSCLLISKDRIFEDVLNNFAAQIDISQNVFFLKEESYEIYEAYKINHVIIKKKLGYVDLSSNNFIWQKDENPNFVKRRSDFHGIVLKGIVAFGGLGLFATDSSYQEKAPYFKNNETYQVNGFTDGLFHDILMTLQDTLNFTTVLYKRKKVAYGFIKYENGTYEGTGMIGDIFFKRVDIVIAPYLFTNIDRANFIDYLFPIKYMTSGIFIPTSNTERFDFKTYLAPFSLLSWITLALTGVTFAVWRFFLLKVYGNVNLYGFDYIWSSFSGFFGGKPLPSPIDKKTSYKTTTIATLLCGTVIWIAYRARLNAELAVYEKKYPFYDMESFSKTNWR